MLNPLFNKNGGQRQLSYDKYNLMFGRLITLLILAVLFLQCEDREKESLATVLPNRDSLNINIGSDPPTLDWSLATDSTSYTIILNIMDGLTRFGKDYKPEPSLAESWDISEDGKTIVFHLRKNVSWSDGRPLKAKEFEYSWKRLLNPKTGADYAYFLYDIEDAEEYNTGKEDDSQKVGVKALDDNTLLVKLKRPASYFLS